MEEIDSGFEGKQETPCGREMAQAAFASSITRDSQQRQSEEQRPTVTARPKRVY
jgi:hypothetical protein